MHQGPAQAGTERKQKSGLGRLFGCGGCMGDEAVMEETQNASYQAYVTKDYMQPRSQRNGEQRRASSAGSSGNSRPCSSQSDRFARVWDSKEVLTANPVDTYRRGTNSFTTSPVIEEVGLEGISDSDIVEDMLAREQLMADEIADFAEHIGIDPRTEPHLMGIAEDFYASPLPDGWTEHWTDDDLVYYAVQHKGHTQWQHPMEQFYRAQVFLWRTGFKKIQEEQQQNPPRPEEIAEMAEYLGVSLEEEPYLLDTVKMAVGAPLPPEWHEDRSGTKFVHEMGAISSNHPLDVYFLETIRMKQEEQARLEREGREAIERAQKASVRQVLEAEGDNFKILGVKKGASRKEVRDRYRTMALQVHPDKNPQKGATEAFHLLNTAFKECMDMSVGAGRK